MKESAILYCSRCKHHNLRVNFKTCEGDFRTCIKCSQSQKQSQSRQFIKQALGFLKQGLKGQLCYITVMETLTTPCNKCKQALPVDVFGDSGKGACFKTCDACRARGRANKHVLRLGNKKLNLRQPQLMIMLNMMTLKLK